jgi:hypothetical protein
MEHKPIDREWEKEWQNQCRSTKRRSHLGFANKDCLLEKRRGRREQFLQERVERFNVTPVFLPLQ